MRRTEYEDSDGRMWLVSLPDGALDSDASMGLIVGPPSLEPLGLPLEIEVTLHNTLFARKLFTLRDVRTRRNEIFRALQSALKVPTYRIVELYQDEAKQELEGQTRQVQPPKEEVQQPEPLRKAPRKKRQRRKT